MAMRIKTGGDPGGVHLLHVLPHGAPVPRLRGIVKGNMKSNMRSQVFHVSFFVIVSCGLNDILRNYK